MNIADTTADICPRLGHERPIAAYLMAGPLCSDEGSLVRVGACHECSVFLRSTVQ